MSLLTNSVGIVNANRRTIDQAISPGPDMRETLHGRLRTLELAKVIQTVVDFQTVETFKPLRTQGVVQPLSGQKLALKREGTRTWDWRLVHVVTDLELQTEDIIVYRGTKYTVMNQWDFSDYGYFRYEIVNSYGNNPRT